MIDDIVTRLRTALETDESILLTMPRPTVQMMADEIERLRADRDNWRSIAELAVDNADQAVKLLEKLTGVNRD